MKPYRFRIFRWLDSLTFGLAAVASTAMLGFLCLTHGSTSVAVLLSMLSFVFWWTYAIILVRRIAFKRSIAYITVHGLVVLKSRFDVAQEAIDQETRGIIALWHVALRESGTAPILVIRAINGTIVRFVEAPFVLNKKPTFPWMGLFSELGEVVTIGYRSAIGSTTLAHELGHVILMYWRNDGSEETLRTFHDRYATPF